MSLLGVWFFTAILYQDQLLPKPNPHLHIRWYFEDERSNTLTYWRDNERGFCERRAFYRWDQSKIWQQVIWVNPKNEAFCSADTDMQIGNISEVKILPVEDFFFLEVSAGDEPLFYQFEKQEQL